MNMRGIYGAVVFCVLLFGSSLCLAENQSLLRFLKPTYRTGKAPIVLVAFGTSTKAQITFDHLDRIIRGKFPGHPVRWAFTSRIIREKLNRRFREQGVSRRLESLPEVLSGLQAGGYRNAVVQSLHIFPGEEYVHMQRQARIDGLKVAIGEPVFATWEDVNRVMDAVGKDIPEPGRGCAILVGHGSPNTYAAPSTAVYLALARLIETRFGNAFLGSVEGVPDRREALDRAKKCAGDQVNVIPLMLVAGDHVMNDIMGDNSGESSGLSWAGELKQAGKKVRCSTVKISGEDYYRGLGFYPVVDEIIVEHIKQAMRDL